MKVKIEHMAIRGAGIGRKLQERPAITGLPHHLQISRLSFDMFSPPTGVGRSRSTASQPQRPRRHDKC
ncbi:hypothetical protein HDG41_006531 [Paraburkholderia sp. JPY162]|uniref:Uncharacterized protein n=1 Tax=Paraburkholderia youngii TaxID=2782701 RepID=A0A7W8LCD2_9BURK|nr:hypothetical protein [Paraburkholderia youngii]